MRPAHLLLIGLLAAGCAARPPAPETEAARSPLSELAGQLTGMASALVNGLTGRWLGGLARQGTRLLDDCSRLVEPAANCLLPARDPDVGRNVSEIIRARGFLAEEHDVHTADGYILTLQRIVNPLVEARHLRRPVILQHGLMSSSVDWVINSLDARPQRYPARDPQTEAHLARNDIGPPEAAGDHEKEADEDGPTSGAANPAEPAGLEESQAQPNALGYYLANRGYDVWLANSRGNLYGQRHERLSAWQPRFWRFTFDEQIDYDLPAVIEFVQRHTNRTRLGYVGHSQGTAMAFGLLSTRPEYADVLEPVVALAPVAFVDHAQSPVAHFSGLAPLLQNINWWFATDNAMVKALAPRACAPRVIRREICENIFFLSVGFDEEQLDESRVQAYLSHMPSGTSVKNIAHWAQMVNSGRFARFDHGILGNRVEYNQNQAPDYPLHRIRSRSLVLFAADNDWLAAPKDVGRLLAALSVQPMAFHNMSEFVAKWNHIDYVYAKSAGKLVNPRIEAALQQVEARA